MRTYFFCDNLVDMLNRLVSDAAGNLIDYAYSAGLSVEYELHAGSYLLPRELFGSRPELFRLSGDKRTPDVNFCVSDKEALSIASGRAVYLMKCLYRLTDNYYFRLDDVKIALAIAKNVANFRYRTGTLRL